MLNRAKITLTFTAATMLVSLFAQTAFNTQVAHAAIPAAGTWNLVWADDFNGANGSVIDPAKWVFDTGGKWGNGTELQYYTNRTANAQMQNGNLAIIAKKENYSGNRYTSARIKTQNKFTQTYGRYEARIKIPYGQGIWPAFWLLGADIDTSGWPMSGEIDIMEHVNMDASIVSTIHMPGTSGDAKIGEAFTLPNNTPFSNDYHIYAVEWEADAVRFYVDSTLFQTIYKANMPAGYHWVFDKPFFIILNIAVGGNWPGSPDKTTTWPQTMLVDYVRVYSR
jgi:beta-glucanase (GH16 family)